MVRWRALGYWSMGYFAARDSGHQREYIGDDAFPPSTRAVPAVDPDSRSGTAFPSQGTHHRPAFPATMLCSALLRRRSGDRSPLPWQMMVDKRETTAPLLTSVTSTTGGIAMPAGDRPSLCGGALHIPSLQNTTILV
jgi:hypothetical protein